MLALWWDDIRLCRKWGYIHLRPRLHTIRMLGDVLLTHASGHVFMADVHHPLSRDVLCHQPCVRSKLSPSVWMSSVLKPSAYPLQIVVKSRFRWYVTIEVYTPDAP